MAASKHDDDGLFAHINVTPLVDITLVLLVVFMVAAPLIVSNPSIKVALPKAVTAEETKASTLVLSMTRAPGGYRLFEGGHETSEASIRTKVPPMVKTDPELQAIIAADRGIAYGDVMHVVDLVRELGVTKFALNAESGSPGTPGS
jgi:biopolymer transport protein TolR